MLSKKIWRFLKKLYKVCDKTQLSFLAGQITFSFVMAFFPFLIFILTLVNRSHIDTSLFFTALKQYMPKYIFDFVMDIFENANREKSVALSIGGLLGAYWVTSRAVSNIMLGINRIYNKNNIRPFIKRTSLSLLMTAAFIILIFSTMILLVFGRSISIYIFDFFGIPFDFTAILNYLRYELSTVFLICTFILIYRLMPEKKTTISEVLPGSFIASLGWLALSYAFSFYIDYLFKYSSIYGSIGGIILLLIWLNWSIYITLIGAAINYTLFSSK